MAKIGRKSLLTPELQEEICQYLKEGHYQVTAIDLVGIAESTYYHWLQQGEEASIKYENGEELTEKETIYMEFLESIKKAIAFSIRRDVAHIDKAGEKDWKARAWKLERMKPALFSLKENVNRQETINHNVHITEDVNVKVELSDERAERIATIIRELEPEPKKIGSNSGNGIDVETE